MKQYSLAVDQWSFGRRQLMFKWMEDTYGKDNSQWYVDYDYDRENLIMNADVFTAFSLRWL